jgi:tellurite resistance protein
MSNVVFSPRYPNWSPVASGDAFVGHSRPDPAASHRSSRRHARPQPPETLRPGRATVQAVLMAAAMIACADGHVDRRERRSVVRFLRGYGVLAHYGRAATLAAFDRAVQETAPLDLQETCVAADSLRSVAHLPGAPLVAHAAAVVALADGVTWPQEIALLEVIRERVGLGAPHYRDDDR